MLLGSYHNKVTFEVCKQGLLKLPLFDFKYFTAIDIMQYKDTVYAVLGDNLGTLYLLHKEARAVNWTYVQTDN